MLNIADTKGLKVGIYNRCSTLEESQVNALELQAEQSREIAQSFGWNIAEQYVESVSGTTTDKRTEYKRMIQDMQSDKFDIVLIKSLDRLMRSCKDWYEFVDLLCRNKKQLYIYMDNKFFDTSQHGFMAGIEMAMHSQFSRVLSDKLKNSHKWRQEHKTGFNITSKIYGWDKVEKDVYVINETEAGFIRLAVEMIRQGYGFYSITKKLYELGARNTLGREIQSATWRNILMSERLYGCMVLHKTEMNFDTKTRDTVPKDDWVYCEDALPAIISKSVWDDVQIRIKSRSVPDNRTNSWGKYPLSKKIVCGCCGSNYHRSRSPRRPYNKANYVPMYKCMGAYRFGRTGHSLSCQNENIDEHKLMCLLEETSNKYFDHIFSDDASIINRSLDLIKKMLDEKDSVKKLDGLKKKLSQQKHKKDILFDKLMNQVISDADFKKYTDSLNEDIDDIEQEIAKLEADTKSLNENKERLEHIKETLSNSDILKRAKGSAFLDMIDKIVVNTDSTLTIKFNKYRLLGLLTLININELCKSDDEQYYSLTVHYDGYKALKDRTNNEKEKLLEAIKEFPTLSYSQYANLLSVTKNDIAARIRFLIKYKYLIRDTDGGLTVLKDWTE